MLAILASAAAHSPAPFYSQSLRATWEIYAAASLGGSGRVRGIGPPGHPGVRAQRLAGALQAFALRAGSGGPARGIRAVSATGGEDPVAWPGGSRSLDGKAVTRPARSPTGSIEPVSVRGWAVSRPGLRRGRAVPDWRRRSPQRGHGAPKKHLVPGGRNPVTSSLSANPVASLPRHPGRFSPDTATAGGPKAVATEPCDAPGSSYR